MGWTIRRASEEDLDAFAEIVDHYILATAIHFGDRPQTRPEWLALWQPLQNRYPWLVAGRGGTIGGIAYARPWNPRRAYDWTTEVTVYVRDGLQGQGIGSALYRRLLELLEAQGFRSMMAGITLPNDASVALHESFGFRQVGTLRRIGFKMGAWHDVGLWQRWVTADPDAEPTPLRPLDEVEP